MSQWFPLVRRHLLWLPKFSHCTSRFLLVGLKTNVFQESDFRHLISYVHLAYILFFMCSQSAIYDMKLMDISGTKKWRFFERWINVQKRHVKTRILKTSPDKKKILSFVVILNSLAHSLKRWVSRHKYFMLYWNHRKIPWFQPFYISLNLLSFLLKAGLVSFILFHSFTQMIT